jgi:hypothetical protein
VAKADIFALKEERSNACLGLKNGLFYRFDGFHYFGFQFFHQFEIVFQ